MKPCRKLRPPTGPISPAQNAPASGQRPEQLVDDAGVVVGHAEQAPSPPVAREQQRGARPRRRSSSVAQVLVGGVGVADVELHGLADARRRRRPRCAPVVAVGAEHVADEEVAAAEVGLVLVDDEADVQAGAHERRGPPR